MPDIHVQADAFRAAVARYEQDKADALTGRYQVVLDTLRPLISQISGQIEKARSNGEPVSPSWLLRQERYKALMAQTEAEINRFAGAAGKTIKQAQAGVVDLAQTHTETLVTAGLSNSGQRVSASFNRLPTEAFENVVGYFGDGSPLKSKLDELGPQGAKAVSDALAKGIALGWNPRKTASEITSAAGVPLTRALAISRTETLRAYRQAAIQTYKENGDVVTGWRWLAALSSRSCAMCVAMHGTVHPATEHFGSHVCCRCCPSPVLIGTENAEFETGADWFAKQDVQAQDNILGSRAAGEAYRAGQVALGDFVGERKEDKWGLTRYARSFSGALNQSSAKAFAPETDGVPSAANPSAAKKKGSKKQETQSRGGSSWLDNLNRLLDQRASFGGWGELLPDESRTDLFPSERAQNMLEHLLKMGGIVQDEAERRLKTAMDDAGLTKKQAKDDSMFVNVNFAIKVVGQQRTAKSRERHLAKSLFGLDVDAVAKDEMKHDQLTIALNNDEKYQAAQSEIHQLRVKKEAALKRLEELEEPISLRRKVYMNVLGEVRDFGLEIGKHAFTWTADTDVTMAQAPDEAAKFYPTDWLNKSRVSGTVKVNLTNRAEYKVAEEGKPAEFWLNRRPPKILGDSETLSSAVHEFGHRFEDIHSEIKVFEALYYRKRTRVGVDEQEIAVEMDPRDINEIKGRIIESLTRLDKFSNQYIGKDMGNSYDSLYELLTMGMEGIFMDKYNIFNGDKDLCRFVMGLLTGI